MSHFDDIEDYYFEKYYIDQKRRMKTMYQNIATKVLTGEVRLSYANLTAPRAAQDGGEPKYSVTLLIPKTDTATKADIDASMKAAYEDGVSKKWGGARPQPKVILHDGDGLRPSGLPFGDECKGCWVLTASSKNKPQVVGIDNIQCELAPQDVYSGMYARVTINFYAFDRAGNKGVGCGLGNVMKTKDGEPLSGGASAVSDFADVGSSIAGQDQPWAQQSQQYAAPAQPANGVRINPITGQPM